MTDFGVSAVAQPGELTPVNNFHGTPKYGAPERFVLGSSIDLIAADVYSLGCTLWAIWTRREVGGGSAPILFVCLLQEGFGARERGVNGRCFVLWLVLSGIVSGWLAAHSPPPRSLFGLSMG